MIEDIINISETLSNFVVAAEGNISARSLNGFIIKPSGYGFTELSKSNLVECDLRGLPVNEGQKPSMEATFHAWIYNNSDCNYIAHTHPINTLKILCTENLYREFANKRLFPDQVIYNGSCSCVIPYVKPGKPLTEQLDIHISEFIIKNKFFPKLILLQNHGIICTGRTAKECIFSSQICEKAAAIFLGSQITNDIKYLSESEVSLLLSDESEKHRINLICQR